MAASSSSVDRSHSVDAFQEISDSVIRKLEDGRPPWLRPRQRLGSLSGFPPSLIVRRTVSTVTVGRDFETAFHDLFAASGLGFEHGAIRIPEGFSPGVCPACQIVERESRTQSSPFWSISACKLTMSLLSALVKATGLGQAVWTGVEADSSAHRFAGRSAADTKLPFGANGASAMV